MLTAAEEREEYAAIVREMARIEATYPPDEPVLVECVCEHCRRAIRPRRHQREN